MELLSAGKLAMLLGLSFFFGLSFEGFYAKSARSRPGGIRTFPQISLSGAILYALEPQFAASTNNVLKAVCSVAFAGWRRNFAIVLSLLVLGLLGCGIAVWLAYGGQAMLLK